MEFKVGDKAVYPGHGVGVVRSVETTDFDGVRVTLYIVKILDNGMTIKVPICAFSRAPSFCLFPFLDHLFNPPSELAELAVATCKAGSWDSGKRRGQSRLAPKLVEERKTNYAVFLFVHPFP